jgi:hypothetical protein
MSGSFVSRVGGAAEKISASMEIFYASFHTAFLI